MPGVDPSGHLRTGDIGLRIAGDLHILGRSRSPIILRGTKIHAEDVGATALDGPGGLVRAAAAFAVSHDRGRTSGRGLQGPGGEAAPGIAAAIAARSMRWPRCAIRYRSKSF